MTKNAQLITLAAVLGVGYLIYKSQSALAGSGSQGAGSGSGYGGQGQIGQNGGQAQMQNANYVTAAGQGY